MKKWKVFLIVFTSIVCFGLGYHSVHASQHGDCGEGFFIDYEKTYLEEAHGTIKGLDYYVIGTEMVVKNTFGIEINRVKLLVKKEGNTFYISEDQKTWKEVGDEGDKIFIVTLCEKAEKYVTK